MAVTYKRFEKLGLDTSVLGLAHKEHESLYFCTPKGAHVLGWAGVDGIHFCFIRGFGEMVFAVSPMNTPGNYVHLLAESFEDFLRLLLAWGDTAALEQAHSWTQEQFEAFLGENPIIDDQRAMLDVLAAKLKLTPMEQPFSYLKELQAAFDYSRIRFTEDYAECVPTEPKLPEWKVYFEGNFWGHHGNGKAGREIPIGKQFGWGNHTWLIPAVYTTGKGLVIDFCMQVPQVQIRAFLDKWNLSMERDGSDLTDEQRLLVDAENPLAADFTAEATVNGRILRQSHGCGICWNPCFPELNGLQEQAVLAHYDLDPAYGWAIRRVALPWETKRKPQLHTLEIRLEQEPIPIPGIHFRVSTPGEEIRFTHPLTKVQHTLTVQEYERQALPARVFGDWDCDYPTHYTVMTYTLAPELSDGKLTVTDCVNSDQPRRKHTEPFAPEAFSDCCVGIIGGADGPTAIVFGGNGQGNVGAACSALHFETVEDIEWRMAFHEKMTEDIAINVIGS